MTGIDKDFPKKRETSLVKVDNNSILSNYSVQGEFLFPSPQSSPQITLFEDSRPSNNFAQFLFERLMYIKDGQEFENFFVDIMTKVNGNFRPVQAWGRIGDRKNDGFIRKNGEYFQVYAPHDINGKDNTIVRKLKDDFYGLFEHWNKTYPIKKFHFVVNDKLKALPPPFYDALKELESEFPDVEFNDLSSHAFRKIFNELPFEQKNEIVGFLPNLVNIETDYDALSTVINHIMALNSDYRNPSLPTPDFEKKIQFNNLSNECRSYLVAGIRSIGELENYFKTRVSIRKELQQKLTKLYEKSKEEQENSDEIFYDVFCKARPGNGQAISDATMVVMAYYFEACDIFEVPK